MISWGLVSDFRGLLGLMGASWGLIRARLVFADKGSIFSTLVIVIMIMLER